MFKFIKYISFLLSATNQHGVHSPFIYDFVTKCLYKKENNRQGKSITVLLKSIAYFKSKSGCIKNDNIKNIVSIKHPYLNYEVSTIDIGYLDKPDARQLKKLSIHNNSMVLIDKIYQNKESIEHWELIKNLNFVTVTVDLFCCGIVFFRKEQEKEHFKIRI